MQYVTRFMQAWTLTWYHVAFGIYNRVLKVTITVIIWKDKVNFELMPKFLVMVTFCSKTNYLESTYLVSRFNIVYSYHESII